MRQEDSRRPVWEFADRVEITHSVLEAQWKALVVPAPSRRLLRHTLLPLALTSSRSWSAYARRGRSSVGAAFDQQGPDDAGHLVGQSNGDQHFRLASQHLRKPRALGCPAPAGLLNHGTRADDQQAADRPFTAFGNGTEFLLAAGRFLQRRQPEPGCEIAPGREPSAAGTSAVIAVEAIGPTPGIVINRRAVGSDFERWLISASKTAICASQRGEGVGKQV